MRDPLHNNLRLLFIIIPPTIAKAFIDYDFDVFCFFFYVFWLMQLGSIMWYIKYSMNRKLI